MRILLVGNYEADNQASMLRYADMLCRHLGLRGHQVEVIRPQLVVGNLVSRHTIRKWLGYIDKYLFFPAKLRRRSLGFDIVHVCDHSNSMYLRHTAGRPASITCHDLLAIASAQGRYPEQNISSTGKLQQRWILKHLVAARHVVCVSSNTARELADLAALSNRAPQNLSVIPNPLNFDCSPASEQAMLHLRHRLGIPAEERYFFHIGGDHWYKNRLGVLRIFHLLTGMLRASGTPLPRLVMAGEAWSRQMRDFIAANNLQSSVIEVVDPSNEDLCSLYSGADALLFPSLYEGFGWPLIEAQTCGCPVITSNRGPMTEVAGSAALYIDPADEPAAAALIARNLDRLPLLREAGFRNAERFAPSIIFPQYEAFFAAVAEYKASQTTVVTNHSQAIENP